MKIMKNKKVPKLKPKTKKPKSWKDIKIEGPVISDDGGGLEGFIGLEVLENYENEFVTKPKKTRKQLYKEKRELKQDKRDKFSKYEVSESEDSDAEEKPKKKRQKPNKNENEKNVPGKFVLLKPATDNDQDEVSRDEEMPESKGLGVDDLEHWNGLGIPEPILKAIAENGFKTPTQIQALTLPAAIMGKKDILGAAETGSGKTLAFGIPILSGIMEMKRRDVKNGIRKPNQIRKTEKREDRDNCTPPPEELEYYPDLPKDEDVDAENKRNLKPLYALVLTPTRELAVQVKGHIESIAKYTGIKVAAIFGGLATVKQERVLKGCPEIVVATPGRLWELLCMGNSHLSKMDNISFLVIDETDRMVEKGHFEELRLLLNRLNLDENKRYTRQNFVFSATLTLVHDLPDHMQKKNFGRKTKLVKPTPGMKIQSLIEGLGISQPKIVDITNSNQTAQTLTECRLICPIDHKDFYLYYFIQKHPGRTIVFCNSIDCVKRLSQLFGLLDCQPLPLHAQMIQRQRLKNLERFRDNPNGFLIATDVAARGLDIQNVQHVIHYQVPRTSENYVHRSGRTARANKDGITVMIMEPGEVKSYLKLCRTLDRNEDLPIFPVSERHLKSVKERLNLAREVDKLELKLRRSTTEIGWMKKTAKEMDIVLDNFDSDENDFDDDDDALKVERSKENRLLLTKRKELSNLLGKPLFPKGFSYKYPTSTGKLEMPFMDSENDKSAVNVMKDAIEEEKLAKKLRNKKQTK